MLWKKFCSICCEEHLQQLLELFAGLGVHEVIVAKLFDGAAQALRQIVQPLVAALGPLLQKPHGGLKVVGVVLILFELLAGFLEPPLYPRPLGIDDVLHAFLQIIHRGVEVIALQSLLTLLTLLA